MNLRNLKGTIMMAICGAAALFAAAMLLYILVVIFLKGVASLNPHFILFSEINTGLGLGTGSGTPLPALFFSRSYPLSLQSPWEWGLQSISGNMLPTTS